MHHYYTHTRIENDRAGADTLDLPIIDYGYILDKPLNLFEVVIPLEVFRQYTAEQARVYINTNK